MESDSLHDQPADELWEADGTAKPISRLTGRYPSPAVEDAAAIQTINIDRRLAAGEKAIGHKVGLTSAPMQQLVGVDEPERRPAPTAHGVYNSFLLHAERAVDRCGVSAHEVLRRAGEAGDVGGQQDMIIDVAIELAERKAATMSGTEGVTR